MTDRRVRRRDGFTLVEVLVSLALVGVVLPVAMAGVTLAMGMGETARHRTEAAALAGGKLAELMATGDWQSSQTSGDFGDEWPAYTWEVNVEDWEEPDCDQVTLTVRWTTRGREHATSLATLAYAGSE